SRRVSPRSRQICASRPNSALPAPYPRYSGSTKRSSSQIPFLPVQVEKVWNQMAKPMTVPSTSAMSPNVFGLPSVGNITAAKSASVASTASGSLSSTASAWTRRRICGRSASTASRMVTDILPPVSSEQVLAHIAGQRGQLLGGGGDGRERIGRGIVGRECLGDGIDGDLGVDLADRTARGRVPLDAEGGLHIREDGADRIRVLDDDR